MLVNDSYNTLRPCIQYELSMITDSFVLRCSDLEKAPELMEFDNGSGTWRKSKDDNNILPSRPLQQKENHEIKIEP